MLPRCMGREMWVPACQGMPGTLSYPQQATNGDKGLRDAIPKRVPGTHCQPPSSLQSRLGRGHVASDRGLGQSSR